MYSWLRRPNRSFVNAGLVNGGEGSRCRAGDSGLHALNKKAWSNLHPALNKHSLFKRFLAIKQIATSTRNVGLSPKRPDPTDERRDQYGIGIGRQRRGRWLQLLTPEDSRRCDDKQQRAHQAKDSNRHSE